MVDCEPVSTDIVEYVLVSVAIIETMLSYTPGTYPKSIVQGIIYIIYNSYLFFKKKKPVEVEVVLPQVSIELVDVIIK
jgi:hypothetical protein